MTLELSLELTVYFVSITQHQNLLRAKEIPQISMGAFPLTSWGLGTTQKSWK